MANNRQGQRVQGKAPFTAQVAPTPTEVAVEGGNKIDVPESVVEGRPVEVTETREEIAAKQPTVKEWLEPHYDFAGANLGGQSVYNCGACWAVVLRDSQPAHSEWHKKIEGA